jgi:hypothetical protein
MNQRPLRERLAAPQRMPDERLLELLSAIPGAATLEATQEGFPKSQ